MNFDLEKTWSLTSQLSKNVPFLYDFTVSPSTFKQIHANSEHNKVVKVCGHLMIATKDREILNKR